MTIQEAYLLFKGLHERTTKKAELKTYSVFMAILFDLKNRDFTKKERDTIEKELSFLMPNNNDQQNGRHYRKQLNHFKRFLKTNFLFITKDYYAIIGMSLGMCFGTLIDISLNESMGVSSGLAIGIFLGILIGRNIDIQAEKENRVLKTTI